MNIQGNKQTSLSLCLHGCFSHVGSATDHPENGSGGLLHLMGAAPSALHCGETKVPDLHCQPFMQEDVCAAVKESAGRPQASASLYRPLPFIPIQQQRGKDTVGLHVPMNDVLRVQVTGNERGKEVMSMLF